MWEHQPEPKKTIYDALEPVASIILIIATLAIIPFTPLSPFQGRETSALDQLAGINVQATDARMAAARVTPSPDLRRIQQAETPVEAPVIAR